ncbi:MAG: PLP-dependent transferase, partial [Leptotrichiaceae bacterium]|nr:PLP-dependent transferase [Leptotrichiaceae bacterium]
MKFETEAIHGVEKEKRESIWGSIINLASTFPVKEFGVEQDYEYSRVSSPTRNNLEKVVAKLENGEYGFAFSSGMAAITSVFTM